MDSPCIKQTAFKVLKIFQHGNYLVAYVLKSIYFDDKLIVRVIFFCHLIYNALLMSLKKYWMKIINCIIFMSNSVQRGQNENF